MDVSYLITVFNKENEIKETISCLQNQTLKSSINIEIICIDDFSSDNSVNIIENLQNEDKRIQHPENSGLLRKNITSEETTIFASVKEHCSVSNHFIERRI